MLEQDKWEEALGKLKGTVIRGTERIRTREVMDVLQVDQDRYARSKVGKPLVSYMKRLGWNGPKVMAWSDGGKGCSGYWRVPGAYPPHATEDLSELCHPLPDALREVCHLSLRKLHQILKVPLDVNNQGLLRAHVTASLGAAQLQLRANDAELRRSQTNDVIKKLDKLIAEQSKLIPKDVTPFIEHEPEPLAEGGI